MGVSERFPAGQHSLPSYTSTHSQSSVRCSRLSSSSPWWPRASETCQLLAEVMELPVQAAMMHRLVAMTLRLLGVIVGILPMALAIKAPLVNLILAPFNLQLCTPGTPPVAFTGRSFSSRSLKDAVTAFGYDVSEDKIEILTGFFNNAMESFLSSSSTYESA